jgi:hypothetical protein
MCALEAVRHVGSVPPSTTIAVNHQSRLSSVEAISPSVAITVVPRRAGRRAAFARLHGCLSVTTTSGTVLGDLASDGGVHPRARISATSFLRPLRDGFFFDLYVQVEEASALIDPRKRGNIGNEVRACLARAKRTRALLDVVGWIEPVEAPTAVGVDARKHREALLGPWWRASNPSTALRKTRRPARRPARRRRRALGSSPTSSSVWRRPDRECPRSVK